MRTLKRFSMTPISKRTTLFLSMLILVVASKANAELFRFNNTAPGQPDYFDWTTTPWLDITSSRYNQSGIDNGISSFAQILSFDDGLVQGTSGSAELEVEDHLLTQTPGGQLVPSGASFDEFGFSLLDGESLLEEGETEYLGVRILLSDWHYGWIGVIRNGNELSAFAWAYETEPNVPAQAGQLIPEPSAVIVLSLGLGLIALKKPQERH